MSLVTPKGFLQARHYSTGRQGRRPSLIVLHTMEAPESNGRAKQVATWFAGPTAPDSSSHYTVDNRDVWACVREADTAWAVGEWERNTESISIELAGYASQNIGQWHDAYSAAELRLAAKLVVDIATRWRIPLRRVSPFDLHQGASGICGHVDITTAYKVPGGHTDPWPRFPWPEFMQLVISAKGTTK